MAVPRPAPRRTGPPRARAARAAAAAVPVLLAVLAAGVVAGCAAPGGLRDHGQAAAVTPPPVPQPLWPDQATAPLPTPPPAASQAPPQPVPEVTAPGRDITAVDVRALLAKDPETTPDERRALESCTGCEVRAPEYRDLTGDGRPELVAAVATAAGPVVLHVYTLSDDRLLPVLRVSVPKYFSATTVGSDLWVYEPTTATARTIKHYHWDGVRLALLEEKLEGLGPITEPGRGSDPGSGSGSGQSGGPDGAVRPTPAPAPGDPAVSVPKAPGRSAPPGTGGGVLPSPRASLPQTVRPTAAPPETRQ
ncbi:hypothetical protein ACWGB8_25505 [Kitasatospora sp. NPDC054939]